jgi:hypothetical protein
LVVLVVVVVVVVVLSGFVVVELSEPIDSL